jgi:hypothetical protein
VIASPPPSLALSASPVRVDLVGAERRTIRLRNGGASPVLVDVGRAGYRLDLLGRPRLSSGAPAHWLRLAPARVTVPAGGAVTLTVASRPGVRPAPGDHYAVALLTSQPRVSNGVAVRTRIGIVVMLHIPGREVHRLELLSLRAGGPARARELTLTIANRGNVAERVQGSRIAVYRGTRLVARLSSPARELLPRTEGIARVRCPRRLHGWVTAVVRLLPMRASRPTLTLRCRLRI